MSKHFTSILLYTFYIFMSFKELKTQIAQPNLPSIQEARDQEVLELISQNPELFFQLARRPTSLNFEGKVENFFKIFQKPNTICVGGGWGVMIDPQGKQYVFRNTPKLNSEIDKLRASGSLKYVKYAEIIIPFNASAITLSDTADIELIGWYCNVLKISQQENKELEKSTNIKVRAEIIKSLNEITKNPEYDFKEGGWGLTTTLIDMYQNPEFYETEAGFNYLVSSEETERMLFYFTGGSTKWRDISKFRLAIHEKKRIIQAIKNKFDQIKNEIRKNNL